jgi:tripartite ATP-independent transporter DctP family solute receptor
MTLHRTLTATAAAALALAFASPGPASAEIPETTLQIAHVYNPGNIWHDTAERYAEAIKERTGGKVTVNIAPGGTTGNWQESIEALQIGTNDIVLESIGTLDRYDPLPGIEAFPYLVRDLDHFKKVYYGPMGGELFDAIEAATGFKIVGAGYRGGRKLSANRKVVSLDDLKGLKLRVPPLKMYRRTWELLGASPVPMPSTEIYTGLQQGVIDGQENPFEVIWTFKFYEHQPYVMETNHVIGAMTFIFDANRFNSFPPELQQILVEEGEKAMLWGTEQMLAKEDQYRADLRGAGVEIVEPDMEAFRAAVAPIKEDFPELADWVEKINSVE